MQKYMKTLMAFFTACGTIISFLADGEFSQNDLIGSLVALAGVFAVYQVRNKPSTEVVVDNGGLR